MDKPCYFIIELDKKTSFMNIVNDIRHEIVRQQDFSKIHKFLLYHIFPSFHQNITELCYFLTE